MAVAILAAELKSNIRERGEEVGGGVRSEKAGLISDFDSNILYFISYTALFAV